MYTSPYVTTQAANPMAMMIAGVLSLFIIILMFVSMWRVNKKLGKPGWACLVPVYSNYVLFDAVWTSKAFAQSLLFMIIGVIMSVAGTVLLTVLPLLALVLNLASIVFSVLSIVWVVRMLHRVSKAFGHGAGFTVGICILPVIFLPILAFGRERV